MNPLFVAYALVLVLFAAVIVLFFLGMILAAVGAFVLFAAILLRQMNFPADVRHMAQKQGIDIRLGWAWFLWMAVLLPLGAVAGVAWGPLEDRSAVYTSSGFLYLLGVALLVVGPMGPLVAVSHWDRFTLLQRARRVNVGETKPGPVVLHGTVEAAAETLEGPFSGVECVCYEYHVKEHHRSIARHGTISTWVFIDADGNRVPFYLTDGSGTAKIDPDDAWLDIGEENPNPLFEVPANEEPPDAVAEFVAQREAVEKGGNITFSASPPDRRYFEVAVEPGDEVTVAGYARINRTAGEPGIVIEVGERGDAVVSDSPPELLCDEVRTYVLRGGPIGAAASILGVGLVMLTIGVP